MRRFTRVVLAIAALTVGAGSIQLRAQSQDPEPAPAVTPEPVEQVIVAPADEPAAHGDTGRSARCGARGRGSGPGGPGRRRVDAPRSAASFRARGRHVRELLAPDARRRARARAQAERLDLPRHRRAGGGRHRRAADAGAPGERVHPRGSLSAGVLGAADRAAFLTGSDEPPSPLPSPPSGGEGFLCWRAVPTHPFSGAVGAGLAPPGVIARTRG